MTHIFNFKTVNGLPYCYIDNFFTFHECIDIVTELSELKEKLVDGALMGGASDEQGRSKKHNLALFLDDFYDDREESVILEILSRKVFCRNLMSTLKEYHWYFRHLEASEYDATQVCYYDDEQSYESHQDSSLVTFLAWFHTSGSKRFHGGDMVLENESFVRYQHNRVMFIPGIMNHEVTPIILPEEFKGQGFGRWSISKFINYKVTKET